jgi:hypothetical protein
MFLPFEAAMSVDAIVRALFRMNFTRRHLLEWQTASHAEKSTSHTLSAFLKAMWFPPVVASAVLIAVIQVYPEHVLPSLPLIACWLVSPFVAWKVSIPGSPRRAVLSERDVSFLHKLSRRTWRFFEEQMGEGDHWLPPDNVQEHPIRVTAHRTSPTNIGLTLLSTLAAFDFGYITYGGMIDRLSRTLESVENLKKFRGHLYNWYRTSDLEPLPPFYISSVDNGNLAAYLHVLSAGLTEAKGRKMVAVNMGRGILTTLELLTDAIRSEHRRTDPFVSEFLSISDHIRE